LYWLLKKEYKIAISTIITLIVLWAITIPILGWQLHLNYFEWFRIYPHYVYQQPQIIDNNKSTYAWFYDHFHSLITARILFVATNLTWIGIWGWKIWKYKPASVKESWLEYGWTLALIPLLTHYMEDHHLVLCALLMIMIIRYADTPLPGWYWPLMAMGCFMIDIIAYIYEFSFVPHEYFSLFYFLLYGQIITWLGGTYLIYKISRKKSNNNV
jgi:hypothetical protein